MSIIHNERAILREAYNHLDDALARLNTELKKEEQAHSNTLHRIYQDTLGDLQSISDALDRPPKTAIQRLPALRNNLTVMLAGCYEMVNAMQQLQAKIEEVLELTQQAQIDYNTTLITGESHLRNDEPYDRHRPHQGTRSGTSLGEVQSDSEAPGLPLVDLDPGNLQQGQDLARPIANGPKPRRKRRGA